MDAARRELDERHGLCQGVCTAQDAFLLTAHYHRMRDFGLLDQLLEEVGSRTRRCSGPAACALRQMIE